MTRSGHLSSPRRAFLPVARPRRQQTKKQRLRLLRVRCTPRVLPADPVRTVRAVFALPSRNTRFDAIDQRVAGAERSVAMRRAHDADDCGVSDFETADAVERCETRAGDFARDFFAYRVHLFLG